LLFSDAVASSLVGTRLVDFSVIGLHRLYGGLFFYSYSPPAGHCLCHGGDQPHSGEEIGIVRLHTEKGYPYSNFDSRILAIANFKRGHCQEILYSFWFCFFLGFSGNRQRKPDG